MAHVARQVFAIHDLSIGPLPELHAAMDFFPPHARATLSATIAATIEGSPPFDVEVDFVSATGVERRVRSIGEVEMSIACRSPLIGVFQDVTEQYQVQQGLRRSRHRDALTGIANRAGFDRALDDAIAPRTHPAAAIGADADQRHSRPSRGRRAVTRDRPPA